MTEIEEKKYYSYGAEYYPYQSFTEDDFLAYGLDFCKSLRDKCSMDIINVKEEFADGPAKTILLKEMQSLFVTLGKIINAYDFNHNLDPTSKPFMAFDSFEDVLREAGTILQLASEPPIAMVFRGVEFCNLLSDKDFIDELKKKYDGIELSMDTILDMINANARKALDINVKMQDHIHRDLT